MDGRRTRKRYISKPALDYVVKSLKFPLPSVSFLEHHAAKIDMRRGFFTEIFQLLKANATIRSAKEKICVFLYDEVSVSECYEYDQRHDDVLGPHSKMQVSFTIVEQKIKCKTLSRMLNS